MIANVACVFAMANRKDPQITFGDFVALGCINFLYLGLYALSKYRGGAIEKLTDHSVDLALKKRSSFAIGILRCPGCGSRTISRAHAICSAQTCGECSRKYRVSQNKFLINLLGLGSIISIFMICFLKITEAVTDLQAKLLFCGLYAAYIIWVLNFPFKISEVDV